MSSKDRYNVVQPVADATPPDGGNDYIHIPRRPLVAVMKECARGRWRTIVLDSNDCAEVLAMLTIEEPTT